MDRQKVASMRQAKKEFHNKPLNTTNRDRGAMDIENSFRLTVTEIPAKYSNYDINEGHGVDPYD